LMKTANFISYLEIGKESACTYSIIMSDVDCLCVRIEIVSHVGQ